MDIYFSDFFKVSPKVLENYGAFNISLINDLPLFVDPFLLFNSKKTIHKQLHENILQYLRYLRDKSSDANLDVSLLNSWYIFSEVKQNWFGFSQTGNGGQVSEEILQFLYTRILMPFFQISVLKK